MSNSTEDISLNQLKPVETSSHQTDQEVEQQNTKKASGGIWSLFPFDTIMPWKKEPVQEMTSVQTTGQTNSSHAEKDQAVFYKSMNDFMKEAQLASEESGMPIRDVFLLLDQIQLKDQRELMKDSQEVTKKDLLKNIQENRKIQKERIEKMLEAIQRAQKTEFWDHFKNSVSLLQAAVTAVEMGSMSTPIGVVLAAVSIGEAIDSSMFDDAGKKFILEMASKVLVSEEKQKTFKDTCLRPLKLGIGISTIYMTYNSSEGLGGVRAWWANIANSPLRSPSVRGIAIEELNPMSWLRGVNITEFSISLWDKKKDVWNAVSGFFGKQARYLSSTTDIACRGIKTHHEYQGNNTKARLLMIEQTQKQNKTRIDGNLKALQAMVKQEHKMWENQRTVHEGRRDISKMLLRF